MDVTCPERSVEALGNGMEYSLDVVVVVVVVLASMLRPSQQNADNANLPHAASTGRFQCPKTGH